MSKKSIVEIYTWVRLVITSLIFFYALLTIVSIPGISMLWNLKAIENGAPAFLLALLFVILPKYSFKPLNLVARSLAFVASLLLIAPAWQANAYLKDKSSFSWETWIVGEDSNCKTQHLICESEDGSELNSIVCIPNTPLAKGPCILVLHGGGFTTGAAIHGLELAKALASRGYFTVSADYRLAPQTAFPGQINDIDKVWQAFKKLNLDQKIDTNSFFLAGESAGASIALNYAQFKDNPVLKGVINLYGITDYFFRDELPSEKLSELNDMVIAYRGNNSELSISPSNPHLISTQPVLSIHGTRDFVVEEKQASQYHELRIKNKLSSQLFILPWASHLFNHPSTGPSGQVTTALIIQFIQSN